MNATFRAGGVFVALLLSLTVSTFAQTSEDLSRADKQFDLYAYNLALRTYEQVLKNEPRNGHALARIGDCYFQLNRPDESLEWYEKAAQQNDAKADVLRRYAVALMHTGDYVGAKKWFRLYGEGNPKVGLYFADMCEYAIQASKREPLYNVKNEPISSDASDYSAAFLGSKVVFSSSRTDITRKSSSKSGTDYTGSAFNQLFISQRNGESGYLAKPSFLRSDMQNNYNEGPISYSADGNKVVFCRNNFIDGTRQIAEKGINLSMYLADVSDEGNWENVKSFPYNGSDYSTGFPSLSANGKTLVFASTDPAGFGGWDIYVSNLTSTGWSTPRNLGASINSKGNEITPYYDGKNLYFSSDYLQGFGGMDVFQAELGEETISNVYHLGAGINSSRDDYGFIFNPSQNIGYLTSNRSGGRGHEDIWQVIKRNNNREGIIVDVPRDREESAPAPVQHSTSGNNQNTETNSGFGKLYVQVSDDYGNALPDAEVDFMDCGIGYGRTDRNGKYYFDETLRLLDCNVTIRKDGYKESTQRLESFGRRNVVVSLARDQRMEYIGTVMDAVSKKPVNGVDIQLQLMSGRVIQTQSDKQGKYSLFLERDETYFITYNKYGYIDEIVKTRTVYRDIAPVMLTRSGGDALANNQEEALKPVQHNDNSNKTNVISQAVSEPAPKGEFSGYSIQLAASPVPLPDSKLKKFEDLTKIGNIYAKDDKGTQKIRLGIYATKEEADKNLKQIKKKHKDAFVVNEYDEDKSLVMGDATPVRPVEHSTGSNNGGAKGIAATNNAIVYAVQVGSFTQDKALPIGEYTTLSGLGNLYTRSENGINRVRLGVWPSHADAEAAQKESVQRGFNDALIVTEKGADESLKGFMLKEFNWEAVKSTNPIESSNGLRSNKGGDAPIEYSSTTAVKPVEYTTDSKTKVKPIGDYYLRVATLSNPNGFDSNRLDGIGGVYEKRTSETGNTIILLGGFTNMESAIEAHNRAIDRGFSESYIVKEDKKGKLVRLKD